MMRRVLLLLVTPLLLGIGVWVGVEILASPPVWTTSCREALEEFELGLEAERRYYQREALEHFRKALELDPEFAMAKLKVLNFDGVCCGELGSLAKEEKERLLTELEALHLDDLTEREAFLLRCSSAYRRHDHEARLRVLEEYLEKHPLDPYALELHCESLWRTEDWPAAEDCYQKLLAVAPNWVTAQNRLGYLTMAQGRFADAEEQFRTYRFIAPDQANPHDSLGELLTLLGRYDEARQEFEEALRIRPDFCASYQNLIDLSLYSREPDRAASYVKRAYENGTCEEMLPDLECRIKFATLAQEGAWEILASTYRDSCLLNDPFHWPMVHRAAVLTGDLDKARHIEERIRHWVSKKGPGILSPELLHLQGLRLTANGDLVAAVARFEKADRKLDYWGQRQGMFRLFNRLHWAHALTLAGHDTEAVELVARVEEVNAPMAEQYRQGAIPMPVPIHKEQPASAAESRAAAGAVVLAPERSR